MQSKSEKPAGGENNQFASLRGRPFSIARGPNNVRNDTGLASRDQATRPDGDRPTRASDHDIGAGCDQIPFDRVALVPSTPLVSEQIAAPEGDEHQRTTGDAQDDAHGLPDVSAGHH